MAEEEAKTKWCPMVRCGNSAENCHSLDRNPEYSRCIASECMMWRWDGTSGWCGVAGPRQVAYHQTKRQGEEGQ